MPAPNSPQTVGRAEIQHLRQSLDRGLLSTVEHLPPHEAFAWAQQTLESVSRGADVEADERRLARILVRVRDEQPPSFAPRAARRGPAAPLSPGARARPNLNLARLTPGPLSPAASTATAAPGNTAAALFVPRDVEALFAATDSADEPPTLRNEVRRAHIAYHQRDAAYLADNGLSSHVYWASGILSIFAAAPQALTSSDVQIARTVIDAARLRNALRLELESQAGPEPSVVREGMNLLERGLNERRPELLVRAEVRSAYAWAQTCFRRHNEGESVRTTDLALAQSILFVSRELFVIQQYNEQRDRTQAALHNHYEQHGHFGAIDAAAGAAAAARQNPTQLLADSVGDDVLVGDDAEQLGRAVRARATQLMELCGYADDPKEALELYTLAAAELRRYCAQLSDNVALRGGLAQMRAMYQLTYGDTYRFDPPELPPTP